VKDGDYLFKLWFSIDKETQAKRFQMRQQSPVKYCKYSPNDEKMQDMWDRFSEFKQKLFDKTSTVNHPWVILDANDKRVSGLNAIRYVLQNIPYEDKNKEVLDKDFPEAMTVLKPEIGESKNINEDEGADPKNPDSHPDLDDWGPDSWWTFEDWKTWFNSSVKKYGWDKAKQNFARFWMSVEEGTGVGTKNDLDVNWLKQNGLWNPTTNKPYTRDEMMKQTQKKEGRYAKTYSNSLINYLKSVEEFVPCVYDDGYYPPKCYKPNTTPKGTLTIGYGTVYIPKGAQFCGRVYDKEEKIGKKDIQCKVDERQAHNLITKKLDNLLSSLMTLPNHNKLKQGQLDALLSLAYNAGLGGYKNSNLSKVIQKNPNSNLVEKYFTTNWANLKRRIKEFNIYKNGWK
jgi:GH24 family phage-related lysozyme (muramidase)